MSDPAPQKTLKQVTQDDPKEDALKRKDAVLLQPAQAVPAAAKGGPSFREFLAGSGFSPGTRFEFLTEYIGAPIVNPDVAEGQGALVLLTDSTLKLSLNGKISLGDITKLVAAALDEDVNDPEYLRAQIGVYPGPPNSDGERAIKFSQSFEIVTRTQIQLVTENELPSSQIPGGKQDRSSVILDFTLTKKDKPTLELPKLRDDNGRRWFMRVWVEEPGVIKQVIGYRELTVDPKTKRRIPNSGESLQVRTEIEKP